jgi:Carboxypeptidase regulatory-like domain
MRPTFAASLLFLTLSLPHLRAQSPQTSPQTNTGTLHGHVLLADTEAPATGATISLQPTKPTLQTASEDGEYIIRDDSSPKNLYATVDAKGLIEIDHIPPGDYTIRTYKPGYIPQDASSPIATLPGAPSIQKVHVSPRSTQSVTVRLERGGAIEGVVRLSGTTPSPIPGAAVSVEIRTPSGKLLRFGGAAHTDAQGRYRIDGLPPATYIVFTALPSEMVWVNTNRGRLAANGAFVIYAPAAIRSGNAQLVAVNQPQTYGAVDIAIPTANLHTLSGKLIDKTGRPLSEGLVRLYPTGEPNLSRAMPVDRNGEFSFDNVPDEHYTLAATFEGTQQFLGVTEDKTGIRMRINKPLYQPASIDVQVSGQNPPALTLTVEKSMP